MIIAVLTSPRFCDKSVAQTWATLLDEGTYLGSIPSMHRLLRVDVGRCDVLVAESECDDSGVDVSVQKPHRGRVPQRVRGHPFAQE